MADLAKIALGGTDLTTAYGTTVQIELVEAALTEQADADSLLSFAVETPGRPLPLA